MTRQLHLDNRALDAIERHARRAWPEECCGLLLGHPEGQTVVVAGIRESDNLAVTDRARRFILDPRVLVGALVNHRSNGRQVVGFYHSHPDGGSQPSALDGQDAWSDMAYLIIGMSHGRIGSARAWLPPPHHSPLTSHYAVGGWRDLSLTGGTYKANLNQTRENEYGYAAQ